MSLRRVTVLLRQEEYDAAKRGAGLVPLSAWFRSLAMERVGRVEVNEELVGFGIVDEEKVHEVKP